MRDHRIEYMALDALKEWDDNPKAHDIYKIKLSYKHHGFVTPVVMDEKTGRLVAGHGRLQALKDLKAEGADQPIGIKSNGISWLVPVVRGITFEDERAARAYLIADNALTIKGGWDPAKFDAMMNDIMASGLTEAAGFTMDEAEDLLSSLGTVPDVDPGEFGGAYADNPSEEAERAAIQHEPHREVVLLLLDSEHEKFVAQVNVLKKHWGCDTLKQVMMRAMTEAVETAVAAAFTGGGGPVADVPADQAAPDEPSAPSLPLEDVESPTGAV